MAAADEPLAATPFGACPVPQSRYDHVLLGHGSGGQLTAELIQRLFVPGFANDVLGALEDQATVSLGGGKGDGVFITTSGIGLVPEGRSLSVHAARPGDRVLVSGTLGDHGIAVMSVREGLEFETVLESDTAPLNGLAEAVLAACPRTRCMRDPTRGGLSSALNELAAASRAGVALDEAAIPLRPEVRGACEMLGLDPLYVANEGKLIAAVPPADAERLLEAMRRHPLGKNAALIGEVVDDHEGLVIMKSLVGGERVLTM